MNKHLFMSEPHLHFLDLAQVFISLDIIKLQLCLDGIIQHL